MIGVVVCVAVALGALREVEAAQGAKARGEGGAGALGQVAVDPSGVEPRTLLEMGMSADEKGDFQRAVKSFLAAKRLVPDDVMFANNYGRCGRASGADGEGGGGGGVEAP
jgi:hypothetical protein